MYFDALLGWTATHRCCFFKYSSSLCNDFENAPDALENILHNKMHNFTYGEDYIYTHILKFHQNTPFRKDTYETSIVVISESGLGYWGVYFYLV